MVTKRQLKKLVEDGVIGGGGGYDTLTLENVEANSNGYITVNDFNHTVIGVKVEEVTPSTLTYGMKCNAFVKGNDTLLQIVKGSTNSSGTAYSYAKVNIKIYYIKEN